MAWTLQNVLKNFFLQNFSQFHIHIWRKIYFWLIEVTWMKLIFACGVSQMASIFFGHKLCHMWGVHTGLLWKRRFLHRHITCHKTLRSRLIPTYLFLMTLHDLSCHACLNELFFYQSLPLSVSQIYWWKKPSDHSRLFLSFYYSWKKNTFRNWFLTRST